MTSRVHRPEDFLTSAAEHLVLTIERNEDAREVFEAVVRLIAFAAQVEGVPPQKAPAAVAPVAWSLAGADPLRRTADRIYRTDSSVEIRVRELHALVAPYVEAGAMRELAWNLSHAWGDVATSLVRPLWELAYG